MKMIPFVRYVNVSEQGAQPKYGNRYGQDSRSPWFLARTLPPRNTTDPPPTQRSRKTACTHMCTHRRNGRSSTSRQADSSPPCHLLHPRLGYLADRVAGNRAENLRQESPDRHECGQGNDRRQSRDRRQHRRGTEREDDRFIRRPRDWNGIGIDQVHQRPALEGETTVPVVIWTQEAKESTVREALAAIDALDDVSGESSLIRIEEDL